MVETTDKVLCPWCGSEMQICVDSCGEFDHKAWMSCFNPWCSAEGPLVIMKTEGEAIEAVKAAALRRYTPPLKPMTWDEVAAMPEMCWYERVEGIEYPILPMAVHGGALKFAIRNGTRYAHTEGYNRTWRCWERKPTDEERSAAEWIST